MKSKDWNDSKEPNYWKDSKDSRDWKDSKDSNDWKDSKDSRDWKDSKDSNDWKDAKESKDWKDSSSNWKDWNKKSAYSWSSKRLDTKRLLPIQEKRAEVIPVICGTSRVVCLLGETGSGKSTQVPQMILQQDCHKNCIILLKHVWLGFVLLAFFLSCSFVCCLESFACRVPYLVSSPD